MLGLCWLLCYRYRSVCSLRSRSISQTRKCLLCSANLTVFGAVLQLSEGAQQDPCDYPARDLFLESPNPSIMPSSISDNPLVSSATTDYPEPSSAASWARAQHLQMQQQQQRGAAPGSATGGGYTGSTGPPPSSGVCSAPYATGPLVPASPTYPPESVSYGGGPLPPSSRGGVSGYSGATSHHVMLFLFRVPAPQTIAYDQISFNTSVYERRLKPCESRNREQQYCMY